MSLAPLGPIASDIEERARPLVEALKSSHDREIEALRYLNSHYRGTQPLSYMAPELLMELGDRMRQVVVHWPELVIDSTEERLDVEGFRLGGKAAADDDLWSIWQGNGLDLHSHQAQIDAQVMRRSFLIVGERSAGDLDPSSGVDSDTPLITVESPLEVHAARDPRTRRVASAAKWWTRPVEGAGPADEHATLYLPDGTAYLVKRWSDYAQAWTWTLDEDGAPGWDPHGLGVVPVVPIVNRPRTSAEAWCDGSSDLDAVIPLSDAACKIATDMMVSGEFHAMPRRYVLGASEEDFEGPNGQKMTAFSRIAGRIWALTGKKSDGTEVGTFPEASLTNFHETMRILAQTVASVAGLPPHYLGMSTDNPASADAIRSGEMRLVKRAERKQRTFGESYEQAQRIALLIRDGKLPPGAARMETLWRDAATPTIAQAADAVVKKFQAQLIPREQAWEDLGYTAVQQARMHRQFDEQDRRAAAAFGLDPGDQPDPSPLVLPATR